MPRVGASSKACLDSASLSVRASGHEEHRNISLYETKVAGRNLVSHVPHFSTAIRAPTDSGFRAAQSWAPGGSGEDEVSRAA